MIVVHRFDGPEPPAQPELEGLLTTFAALPGFQRGRLGRTTEDPAAWLVITEWAGAGAYRRALSAYDVKLLAPLLGRARSEASAFEVLAVQDQQQPLARNPSERSGWTS